MTNTLDQELYRFVTQLNEEEKSSVLQLLKTFLKDRTQSSGRISLEEYNLEIDEALAEAAAGNYITQEEMEKQAAGW